MNTIQNCILIATGNVSSSNGIFILVIIAIGIIISAIFWIINTIKSQRETIDNLKKNINHDAEIKDFIKRLSKENTDLKNDLNSYKEKLENMVKTPPLQNGIKITDEFMQIEKLIQEKTPAILVTGGAGTGKSTLVKYLQNKYEIICLAPTGIAALNINGSTIHRFFEFPLKIIIDDPKEFHGKKRQLIERMSTLIIDEVSMVKADMMDGIDKTLRKNRPQFSDIPFGGVQLILVGDLFQLPPIVKPNEKDFFKSESKNKNLKNKNWNTPWFFDSFAIKDNAFNLMHIELTESFRQKDKYFFDILNSIRLKADGYETALTEFNKLVNENPEKDSIIISARNETVDDINADKLKELSGISKKYKTEILDEKGNRAPFNREEFSSECPALYNLELKKDASVMFLVNDPNGRFINGSIGTVDEILEDLIKVKINNTLILDVVKHTWEAIDYEYDEDKQKYKSVVKRKYIQYPLTLAWAFTIHKSQGQTIKKIYLKINGPHWASGQTYVALSRCPELNGIRLSKSITTADIKIDSAVVKFFNSLNPKKHLKTEDNNKTKATNPNAL